MGAGAVTAGGNEGWAHLLDPNRKWYNNRRYVSIGYVVAHKLSFSSARSQNHCSEWLDLAAVSSLSDIVVRVVLTVRDGLKTVAEVATMDFIRGGRSLLLFALL